jgi:hypothetical protein
MRRLLIPIVVGALTLTGCGLKANNSKSEPDALRAAVPTTVHTGGLWGSVNDAAKAVRKVQAPGWVRGVLPTLPPDIAAP